MTSVKAFVIGAASVLAPVMSAAQYPAPTPSSPAVGTPQNPPNASTPAIASTNPSPYATDTSMSRAGGTDPQTMQDKIFVRKATEGGFAEVQLGQLAAQKSSNDDVKKLGQTMVEDHIALNDRLFPVADSMGVRLPKKMNKDDQEEYDKLAALSGSDFDKEYLACMLKNHRKDLHDFRTEDSTTNDPTLKETVEKSQRVIAGHLRMVAKLAKAEGIPTGRPAPPPPPPQ